jgi:hypothetical protein
LSQSLENAAEFRSNNARHRQSGSRNRILVEAWLNSVTHDLGRITALVLLTSFKIRRFPDQ